VTPAEARERYGVTTSHADAGDRLTGDDGTDLVVLESARDGTRRIVHADVLDHSRGELLATGLAGFLTLVVSLMVPLAAALWIGLTNGTAVITVGVVGVGVVVAFYAANLVLYRTPVHDWVFRFLEWNDNRTLVEAHRQRGEVA